MNPVKTKNVSRLRFRNQLAISFCLGIAFLAIATSFAVSQISGDMVDAQQVEQGLEITESFAEQSKLALLYHSEELAADVGKGIAEFPGVIGIKIEAVDGTILYRAGEVKDGLKPFDIASEESVQLLSGEEDDHWTFVAKAVLNDLSDDWSGIYGDESEPEDATIAGYVTINVGQQGVELIQRNILRANLLVSLAVASLLLLLLIAISRRITNPLEILSSVMKEAEEGDKSVRSEIRGPVDIVNMQHAFNTMMTELEKREEQLRFARDSALELARVKGEFAANVTHELRTPMNAVLGMMDLLLTMGLNSKQKEYVETAKVSGENLLSLIEEILNFSEIDADKSEVTPSDCYLHEVLDEVVNLLSSSALKKKLDLGYQLADNVPKAIFVDDAKLRQVLINLVGNAIKFTAMGQVAVQIECLDGGEDGNPLLRFEVSDTGIGIRQSDQERIFEAFRQADSSTTREHGGTGLGLAISKQLVEMMGGDICVSSQPGLGSYFWFTLPLKLPAEEPYLEEAGEKESFDHLRALVVDDSAVVRNFAKQQLDRLNIDVVCVETGLDALEGVRKSANTPEAFDVLFVDQEMPGLKGEDFLKLVEDEEQLKDTLVVFLVNPWDDTVVNQQELIQLSKPLLSTSIYHCLHDHFFQTPAEESQGQAAPVMIDQRSARKVLVVDDNRPNQQVACGMLERLGCTSEVVSDGKEAVEAVVRGGYDMVLMDCHMPVLDGYGASQQIRMYEGGDKKLPIVAMTANNSKDEAKRCFEAGMTEFLSKPLRMDELKQVLLKLFPVAEEAVTEVPQGGDAGAYREVVLNPDTLQSLRDNVGEVVNSMIEAFLEDTPVYLKSLKGAMAEKDAKAVHELAHTVKGSASNFGADKVVAVSRDIEALAAGESLDAAASLLPLLLECYEDLRKELEKRLLLGQQAGSDNESYDLLIVDDDRSMRLALKNVFDGDVYSVTEAGNGMQAVSICKRKMPDLILMDAMMPEFNGFQACERIRQLPDGGDVPILIITALDNEEAIVEAFKAGATDYVPKPVHFAVMKQRISRLIKASKAEKHVKKLAYHDPLTGLPNRAQLSQKLRLMLNRASLAEKKLAILFMDLDHFKMINDTLGHDAGDLLLKAVADRIRRCVREQDFIARLGGDEFTVVLEDINSIEDVSRVASKICEALAQPFVFLQQKMFVTTSIGISVFPDDGEDSSSLLKHADSAMFSAKENRNGYCFYKEGMEDELALRMEMERELRHAIESNELVLHIQPQMNFSTGKVTAGEALVRWNHPEHGLLPPGRFITLAEETGLINGIGNWVLEEACRLLREWHRKGYPVRLAVNLSGRELLEVGLHKKLSNLLSRFEISPEFLELEITESMLMENPEQSERELKALKDQGLTLAVDDFGSGFSSLNYLKRLPVDVLKIDRTFIQDIETDPNDSAIVAGIVALAKSLNLDVVAEGVETEGQKEKLADLNCDIFQGYLLSKPIPADDFEKDFLSSNFKD